MQHEAQAPTAPFSDWPARRAERLTVTHKGIVIGGAYVRPPEPHTGDADAVQAVLINQPSERSWIRADWAVYVLAAGAAIAWLLGAFK